MKWIRQEITITTTIKMAIPRASWHSFWFVFGSYIVKKRYYCFFFVLILCGCLPHFVLCSLRIWLAYGFNCIWFFTLDSSSSEKLPTLAEKKCVWEREWDKRDKNCSLYVESISFSFLFFFIDAILLNGTNEKNEMILFILRVLSAFNGIVLEFSVHLLLKNANNRESCFSDREPKRIISFSVCRFLCVLLLLVVCSALLFHRLSVSDIAMRFVRLTHIASFIHYIDIYWRPL